MDLELARRGFDKQHGRGEAYPELGEWRPVVGKRTLTEALPPSPFPVQRAVDTTAAVVPKGKWSNLHDLFGGGQREPEQAGANAALARAATGSGAPLPSSLRRELEASLQADLGGVRVHTSSASAAAAAAISARAYTVGNDIHFGGGQFAPESAAGRHLIAHETAHTVQQHGASRGTVQESLEVSQPGDAHEVEAEQFAQAFAAGAQHAVAPVSRGVVARMAIQRFSYKDLAWDSVNKVSKSADGAMGGVYHVTAGGQQMVIKLTATPDFTQFAGDVMRDGVGVASPQSDMVAIDSAAGQVICAAIMDKLAGAQQKEFAKGITEATHFMAMEQLDGASLKRLDADAASRLLSSQEVFHAIGRVAVADAFLGIGDRLLNNQNPGNLMFDTATLQVFAIDNEQTRTHPVGNPFTEIKQLLAGDTRYIFELIKRGLAVGGNAALFPRLQSNAKKYEKWVTQGAEQGVQQLAQFCRDRKDMPEPFHEAAEAVLALVGKDKASNERCVMQ